MYSSPLPIFGLFYFVIDGVGVLYTLRLSILCEMYHFQIFSLLPVACLLFVVLNFFY